MSPPLSRRQKAVLSQLAKAAFGVAKAHFADDGLSSEEWRRREAVVACGSRISAARNEHYNALKAHFENLAGNAGRAFESRVKESTDRRRQLLHLIERELEAAGLASGYASAISLAKFKQLPSALGDHELSQILITIRARVAAKSDKLPLGPTGLE